MTHLTSSPDTTCVAANNLVIKFMIVALSKVRVRYISDALFNISIFFILVSTIYAVTITQGPPVSMKSHAIFVNSVTIPTQLVGVKTDTV